MKKIRLTESELIQIIKRIVNEQATTVYTKNNPFKPNKDSYEYAFEEGVIYTKKKNSPNWIMLNPNNNANHKTYFCAIDKAYGKQLGIDPGLAKDLCAEFPIKFSGYNANA